MAEYLGYQLNVNGLKLPFPNGINSNIIEAGSYKFKKVYEEIEEWRDMNGTVHREYYADPKVSITFTIKERSIEQNALLSPLFGFPDNIEVQYWDDELQEYKIGYFDISTFELSANIATEETIYYGSVKIVLTEH